MNSSITIRLPGLGIPTDDREPSVVSSEPLVVDSVVSDEALISQVCEGSREALGILFRRYARVVRAVAFRILRDTFEADDLLQDIFLFVHRKCSLFDPSKGSVRSWILKITYNRAIDHRRYLQSRHFYKHVDVGDYMEVADSRSVLATEDREALADVVGRPTIDMLLETLTDDQRKTLNLHFFEGCTFEEIAGRLDQSVGNIRHHYYRGLDKLRKELFARKLAGHQTCGKK
jgi:RNA polymerase sigma-70 factor, ECF subfamily